MSLVARWLRVVIKAGIKRGREVDGLTREDDLFLTKKCCSSPVVGRVLM